MNAQVSVIEEGYLWGYGEEWFSGSDDSSVFSFFLSCLHTDLLNSVLARSLPAVIKGSFLTSLSTLVVRFLDASRC